CVIGFHFFFFFQAEDGIRDGHVTGVQTCALPIYRHRAAGRPAARAEREAGPEAAVGRDTRVPALLRTVGIERRLGTSSRGDVKETRSLTTSLDVSPRRLP